MRDGEGDQRSSVLSPGAGEWMVPGLEWAQHSFSRLLQRPRAHRTVTGTKPGIRESWERRKRPRTQVARSLIHREDNQTALGSGLRCGLPGQLEGGKADEPGRSDQEDKEDLYTLEGMARIGARLKACPHSRWCCRNKAWHGRRAGPEVTRN